MNISHGGIGEVVNTPDCGSGMREFDSHISPHLKISRIIRHLYEAINYIAFYFAIYMKIFLYLITNKLK